MKQDKEKKDRKQSSDQSLSDSSQNSGSSSGSNSSSSSNSSNNSSKQEKSEKINFKKIEKTSKVQANSKKRQGSNSLESGECAQNKVLNKDRVKVPSQQGSSANQNVKNQRYTKQLDNVKGMLKSLSKAQKVDKIQAKEKPKKDKVDDTRQFTQRQSETFEKVSTEKQESPRKKIEPKAKNSRVHQYEKAKVAMEDPKTKAITHQNDDEQAQNKTKGVLKDFQKPDQTQISKPSNILIQLQKNPDGFKLSNDEQKEVQQISRPKKVPLIPNQRKSAMKSGYQTPQLACSNYESPIQQNEIGSPVHSQRNVRQSVMMKSKQPELQIMERNMRLQTNVGLHNQVQNIKQMATNKTQQSDRDAKKIQGGKMPRNKDQSHQQKYNQTQNLANPDLSIKKDTSLKQSKKRPIDQSRLISQGFPQYKTNLQPYSQAKSRLQSEAVNLAGAKKRDIKGQAKALQKQNPQPNKKSVPIDQESDQESKTEQIKSLRKTLPKKRTIMGTKEYMYLITVYMELEIGKKSQNMIKKRKQLRPDQIMKKIKDIQQRLDYIDLDQVKYAMNMLVDQGKMKNQKQGRFQMVKNNQKQ